MSYENSSKIVQAFKEMPNLSGNSQDEQPAKKRILLDVNKRIAKSILPSISVDKLHAYNRVKKHCTYPNYGAIPNTSKIGKRSPSLILGQPVSIVQTPII
mgnify:CR=1 FL=1